MCVCVSRHAQIFSVTVDAALFKVGEQEKRRSLSELVNSGAARLMVRLSVSESNFSRLCKLAFSRFHMEWKYKQYVLVSYT